MNDLISKEEVIKEVKKYFRGEIDKKNTEIDTVNCCVDVCDVIRGIEPRYNIDKVICQIRSIPKGACMGEGLENMLINIVRAGVISDK